MMRRSMLVAVVLGLSCASVSFAPAVAVPSVSASVSGYTAIGSGTIPPADWTQIAVTRQDGLNHAQASGAGGQFVSTRIGPGLNDYIFSSAAVQGSASADPGLLRVFGLDRAIATTTGGLPVVNTDTVYTNILASAAFSDDLTVRAPTLALGTPVNLRLNIVTDLLAGSILGYPEFSPHAVGVYVRLDLPGYGPQIFNTESNVGFFRERQLANGNFFYYLDFGGGINIATHVGDVLPLGASFTVFGQANITDSNREFGNFGNFVDATNTTALWFGDLPSGVSITSASGHDFTRDPRLAPIPSTVSEPATWAMLLGFGGVGCISLGRRRPSLA